MPKLKLVDEVKIKKWEPFFPKNNPCYLYDFKAMGVTKKQFTRLICGKKAYLFEMPFLDRLRGTNCPWCDYKSPKRKKKTTPTLQEHIFTHPGKNIVSYQVKKFQEELYRIRLQLTRQGYHECIAMLVEHECQMCLHPYEEGREGMCPLRTTPRNRMRCLKTLHYPIKHLTENKKREHDWSALGVIILLKN